MFFLPKMEEWRKTHSTHPFEKKNQKKSRKKDASRTASIQQQMKRNPIPFSF